MIFFIISLIMSVYVLEPVRVFRVVLGLPRMMLPVTGDTMARVAGADISPHQQSSGDGKFQEAMRLAGPA